MQIKVVVLRRILKVTFPKGIDYHKLALAVGVSDAVAWGWLKHGKVHEQYVPIIEKINFDTVKK